MVFVTALFHMGPMFVSLNFYSLVAVDSSDAKAIVWMKYLMLCPVGSILKQGKEVLKRKGDLEVGKAARSKAWVLAWISNCILMLIVMIRMMRRRG